MIALKENILTKPLFKFLFTCIYELQNWNFEFFFSCYCFQYVSVKPQCFEVFILSLWSFDIMASKRDLRSYFAKSDNVKVKSSSQKDKPNTSCLIQSKSNMTGETDTQLIQQEVKKQVAKSH